LICNIHAKLSFFDWNFFISIESLKFYQELGEVFIQFFSSLSYRILSSIMCIRVQCAPEF
jgi:hypothetical protein